MGLQVKGMAMNKGLKLSPHQERNDAGTRDESTESSLTLSIIRILQNYPSFWYLVATYLFKE